jgi:YD repeat-containing protein
MGSRKGRGAAALFLLAAAPAAATETITYSYDARGRLVQVARTGTVNNGVVTTHQYDKADNRVVKTTTGSANPPPP